MNSVLVRHKWEPYIWLLPSILLMTIFVVFPIGIVFKLAFSEISKAGIVGGFVGFANFKEAVSAPVFGTVMLNTVVWVVSVVGLSTLFGFIIAMTLNQKFHGRKLARSVVVFPWATSLVIQASVWNYIIKYEYGNLNNVLLNLGIIRDAINWRATYQIEFAWECGVGIFVTIPFVTFCVLSGLQSIDAAYYEAATVDGASWWQKLTKITIPLVRPSLTVSTVLNVIYVFNSFPIIYTITKGAPANKTDIAHHVSVYAGVLRPEERPGNGAVRHRLPDSVRGGGAVHGHFAAEGGSGIMERQNKSRLLVCLSCVLITLSVLLLPLAFFETNIFVKRSANTFVGDEKYVEARAEVEAIAAQYEGASIEESVTERVNSKGVATSMVTFTVKEKIKRNGLDFLLGGIGHSEGMTGIGPTNIMRLLLVCLAVSLALAAGASHKTLALAREQLPEKAKRLYLGFRRICADCAVVCACVCEVDQLHVLPAGGSAGRRPHPKRSAAGAAQQFPL